MRTKPTLRVRADGTFTIVQFTDTHWHNGEPDDEQTRAVIEHVLDAEEPDLALFTGDVLEGRAAQDPGPGMAGGRCSSGREGNPLGGHVWQS